MAACSPWPSRLFAFARLFPCSWPVELPHTHNGLGHAGDARCAPSARSATARARSLRRRRAVRRLAGGPAGRSSAVGDAQLARARPRCPVLAPLVLGAASAWGEGDIMEARRGGPSRIKIGDEISWTRGPARTTAPPTLARLLAPIWPRHLHLLVGRRDPNRKDECSTLTTHRWWMLHLRPVLQCSAYCLNLLDGPPTRPACCSSARLTLFLSICNRSFDWWSMAACLRRRPAFYHPRRSPPSAPPRWPISAP